MTLINTKRKYKSRVGKKNSKSAPDGSTASNPSISVIEACAVMTLYRFRDKRREERISTSENKERKKKRATE